MVISLLVLAMVEFVRGALIFSLLPLYGQYVAGYSLGVIGTAISLHYLMDNGFRIPAGWISDRLGGKRLMLGGIVLSGTGLCLMYLHWKVTWFMLGAGLFGLGTTPLWPTVITGVAAKMPLEHMGEALSKVFVAWLVGAGLGPVCVNFVIGRSYKISFILLGGVLGMAFFLALIGKFPRVQEEKKLALKYYVRELWREISSLGLLYPGMFVQTMSVGILMPILVIYARTVYGFSTEQFSYLLIGGGAFTVLLLVPAGKLADRMGMKTPLVGGFLVAGTSLILLPLQKTGLRAMIVGAFLGIAYSFILPAWNGLQARVVSPEKRGTMWAVFMTIEGMGTATGAFIGGKVWDSFGPRAPFFASATVLISMAGFYAYVNLDRLIRK